MAVPSTVSSFKWRCRRAGAGYCGRGGGAGVNIMLVCLQFHKAKNVSVAKPEL